MDNTSINNNTAVVDKKGASIGSSHVGSVQKERVPISPKVVSEISEIIKASEETPSVPTEVKEAGIEEVSDRLTLTDEHKALGIEHAKESTPVSIQPSGMVKLPMSDKEARQITKTIKPDNSIFGLAMLVLKYVKRTMLSK